MTSYWVIVDVRLFQPLELDTGELVVGYYRVFGLWSTDVALQADVAVEVSDGEIVWRDVEIQGAHPTACRGTFR